MSHNQDISRAIFIIAVHDRLVIRLADLGNDGIQPVHDVLRAFSLGTSVLPDIPRGTETLGRSQLTNVGRCDAFVRAVVPFADRGGYADARCARVALAGVGAVGIPWQSGGRDADVEKLEGALGTLAGGDITARGLAFALRGSAAKPA